MPTSTGLLHAVIANLSCHPEQIKPKRLLLMTPAAENDTRDTDTVWRDLSDVLVRVYVLVYVNNGMLSRDSR